MSTTDKKKFINNHLINDPKTSGLKVGDSVIWENDYGVKWESVVIGFNYTDCMATYGNTVYLDKEAFWFPINPNKIQIV